MRRGKAKRKKDKLKKEVLSFENHHFRFVVSFLFLLFIVGASVAFSLGVFVSILGKTKAAQGNASGTEQEQLYVERGSPLDHRDTNPTIAALEDKVIFHGPRNVANIALTFDAEMTDGMRQAFLSKQVPSSYDKRIVDTLISTQTPATFFLTGMWTQLYPEVARQLGQNPLFEIESHSYADTSYNGTCYGLKQIPDTQDLEDIEATQKIIQDTTGVLPKYFRFPGGCYSGTDLSIVINIAGLSVVHWDVVGADGFNENAGSIVKNVVDNTQNGSIIVLHMNGAPTAPRTADALPEIIARLKEKGFHFVSISKLLQ